MENLPEESLLSANAGASQIGNLYRKARSDWSKAQKSQVIETAIRVGQDAASGAENGIRNELRKIGQNISRGRVKGFSKEQRDAIRAVGEGKASKANLLRLIGKGAFGGDGSANIVGGSIGAAGTAKVLGTADPLFTALGVGAQQLISRGAKKLAADATLENARFAQSLVKLGDNSQQIARLYVKEVPKALRSAEELAEIIKKSGGDINKLTIPNGQKSKELKELIRSTISILSAETASVKAVN